MPRQSKFSRRRPAALLLVALSGFALAALTGIAIAKTFTVKTARNVQVTNLLTHTSKREAIVVNSSGVALYTLSGETTRHLKCTSAACLAFWPPVKVRSANAKLTKGPGVNGKLGKLRRKGFTQLTLNGHPLYTFSIDRGRRGVAMGEGQVDFGTWHVVKPSGASGGSGGSGGGGGGTGTSPTSPTGTTMPPYPYPTY
jgi:predicted lipoprotein with Yx(FWY)xxD motif